MSWSYRKNLIGKVRIYYSSGRVGPVQIPLDELADELNDYEARIAELKGVIEILEDQQREAKNILIDKKLHIDSLYEEGYKLQQRIAELEADKERLNSCESTLISMVNQFFYNKAGENIFRHSFMSAEEEAAEYLVEHGIARWVGKNKSAICFNEVQE